MKSAPATRIVPTAAAARGTRHAGNAAIATTTGIAAITGTTVGNTTEEEDAAAREGADGIVPEIRKKECPAKIFAGCLFRAKSFLPDFPMPDFLQRLVDGRYVVTAAVGM